MILLPEPSPHPNLELMRSIAHTHIAIEQPYFIRGLPDRAIATSWRAKVKTRLETLDRRIATDSSMRSFLARRRLLLHLTNVVTPDPFMDSIG